jgi:hypothetical protein
VFTCRSSRLSRAARRRWTAFRTGNWTSEYIVAYSWTGRDGGRRLVAVNYSDHQSQRYVALPWTDLGGQTWRLQDRMGTAAYERSGGDLAGQGLYLDVPAWSYHVFAVDR